MWQAVQSLGRDARVVGLHSTSTAPSALQTAARLRDGLRLNGPDPEQTRMVLNREAWQPRVRAAGGRIPERLRTSSPEEALAFLSDLPQAFIKPASGGRGGRGVQRILTRSVDAKSNPVGGPGEPGSRLTASVQNAFERAASASTDGDVHIEEGVPGSEYSVDFAVFRGSARLLQIARKHATWMNGHPLPIGYARGPVSPGERADADPAWSILASIAQRLTVAFALDATLFTADVILPTRPGGEPAVIDVGYLLDAKVDASLRFSGFDIDGLAVDLATDSTWLPAHDAGAQTRGFATRFWYPEKTTVLRSNARVADVELATGPHDPSSPWLRQTVDWELVSGQPAPSPRSVADLIACLHVEAQDAATAWSESGRISQPGLKPARPDSQPPVEPGRPPFQRPWTE